jgi:hypothetical protein
MLAKLRAYQVQEQANEAKLADCTGAGEDAEPGFPQAQANPVQPEAPPVVHPEARVDPLPRVEPFTPEDINQTNSRLIRAMYIMTNSVLLCDC